MDNNTKKALRDRAEEIRTEIDPKENTAERVGSLLCDIVDNLDPKIPEYISYDINPSPSVLQFSVTKENTFTPNNLSINCVVKKRQGDKVIIISPDETTRKIIVDDTYTLYYKEVFNTNNESEYKEYAGTINVVSGEKESIYTTTVNFYLAENLIDGNLIGLVQQTSVPVIRQGKAGSPGEKGEADIYIVNENVIDTILCDDEGKIVKDPPVTLTTNISLYKGSDIITGNVKLSEESSDKEALKIVGVAPNYTEAPGIFTLSWTFDSEAVFRSYKYKVPIRIIYTKIVEGITIETTYTTYFTVNVVRDGVDGRDGESPVIWNLIPNPKQIIFRNGETHLTQYVSLTINETVGKVTTNKAIDDSGLIVRYSFEKMPEKDTDGSEWPSDNMVPILISSGKNLHISAFNPYGYLEDYLPVSILQDGKDGKDGEKGKDGEGIYYDEEHSKLEYAYSSMGSPDAGGDYPSDIESWSNTIPAIEKGKYLWTKDTIVYSNSDGEIVHTTVSYGVTYQPLDGEGISIDTSRTFIKYCVQASEDYTGEHPNDEDFDEEYPSSLGDGSYLWILNQVAYVGKEEVLKSYSVSRLGKDGADGDRGADGMTTHFAYAILLKELPEGGVVTENNYSEYLSNFQVTNFSGATAIGSYRDEDNEDDSPNAWDYTWTQWKGEKGDKGDQGPQGDKGDVGSPSRFYYYAGDWNSVDKTWHSLTINECQTAYVRHTVDSEVKYYMCTSLDLTDAIYTSDADGKPNPSCWKEIKQLDYLLSKAIFSDYARLGSSIISGDWMMSQHGVMYDSQGGEHSITSSSTTGGAEGTYTYGGVLYNTENSYIKFDPQFPNSSKSGELNFAPNYAVDLLTGATYQQNAYITGGVFANKVSKIICDTYEWGNNNKWVGTDVNYYLYNATEGEHIYDCDHQGSIHVHRDYYSVGKITLKSNFFFILANGIRVKDSSATSGSLHIKLPNPKYFIGQSIVITNKSIGFPPNSLLLEQDYVYRKGDAGEHYICMTAKELLLDYPNSQGLGKDGEPVLLNGTYTIIEDDNFAKEYNPTQTGLYSINGIYEANTNLVRPAILTELDLNEYEWIELVAVEWNVESQSNIQPAIVDEHFSDFYTQWMVTRWEKK